MALDGAQIAWDVLKIVIPAGIGFFVGRYQANSGQKATRIRDCQQNIIKVIRTVMADAARYFSVNMQLAERIAATTLLKAQLKIISTDASYLAAETGCNIDAYLKEYSNFFDMVTKYPFETFGAGRFQVDQVRVEAITAAGEALVAKLYQICTK